MSILNIFIKRAFFAAVYGKGILGKADLLSKLFLISKSKNPIPLHLSPLAYPIYARTGADVAMIIEMFSDHEYEFAEAKNIHKILDIGSNIGSASLYFTTIYSDASIIAVEPDPTNLSKLEMNTKYYPQIKVIRGAIDTSSGERTFYSDKNVGMGSSFTKRSNAQEAYTVQTYTLDQIMKDAGWDSYDLLKFDVEGAEWNIFAERPRFLPRYIIGEFHEDITGKSVDQFIQLFPEYDATKKKIAPKRYILKFIKKVS